MGRIIGRGRRAWGTYPQTAPSPGQVLNFAGPATPPENGSWSQEVWYIDGLNSQGTSSNDNDGLTEETALLSMSEALRRMGTYRPTYPQGDSTNGVVFVFLSDDTIESIIFEPVLNKNALVNFVGVPALVATVTIAAFAAKSAAGPATCQLGAQAAQGLLLVNASRGGSVAWVDSVSGPTQTITQPFAPSVTPVPPAAWWEGGGDSLPAQDNTWANGDTVEVYRLPQVKIARLAPTTVGQWNPTEDGILLMMGRIWVPDLAGTGPSSEGFQCSSTVRVTESRVDPYFQSLGDPNNGVAEQIFNSWLPGCGAFRFTGIYGGAINSNLNYIVTLHGAGVFADAILHGNVFAGTGGEGSAVGGTTFGTVCLTGTLFVEGGPVSVQVGNYPSDGASFYGTYVINVSNAFAPGSLYYVNTAVATFLGTPTLLMNGHTTAQGINRATGQFFFGVTLSPANLDAATPTGFGGIALSNDSLSAYSRKAAL